MDTKKVIPTNIANELWEKRNEFENDYWAHDVPDKKLLEKWKCRDTDQLDSIARFLEITD